MDHQRAARCGQAVWGADGVTRAGKDPISAKTKISFAPIPKATQAFSRRDHRQYEYGPVGVSWGVNATYKPSRLRAHPLQFLVPGQNDSTMDVPPLDDIDMDEL